MITGSDSDDDDFVVPESVPVVPEAEVKQVSSLQLIVHECRYLVAKNRIRGKSDPYVQIRLVDVRGKTLESVKTPVKKNTLNPVFKSQVFNKWRYSTIFSSLVVQVWNKTTIGSDVFLGQAAFGAQDLQKKEMKGWIKLGPRPGQKEKDAERVQGEIKLSIYFSMAENEYERAPEKACLFVTVVEARNVDPWPQETLQDGVMTPKPKSRPGFNSCNPYFYAKFNAESIRGPQLKRTYHPIWNHQHCFQLDGPTSNGVDSTGVLEIRVMHWDRLSAILLDKHIGSISIPLSDFQPAVTVDRWYPLEGGQGKDAWVRLLVKHHDSLKVRKHLLATFGLFALVFVIGFFMEFFVRLSTGIPLIGLIVGLCAGAFVPKNLWVLYDKSFELFPFLAPLRRADRAPVASQPLSGLGAPAFNKIRWNRTLPHDPQAQSGYTRARRLSTQFSQSQGSIVDQPQ